MTTSLSVSDFDYHLPPEQVAQTPVEPRDASRLLRLDRVTGALEHTHFRDLPRLLRPGDLLVANDSRVLPARLYGRKQPGGGQVELLLLRAVDALTWETLARGRGLRPGVRLRLGEPDGLTVDAEILGETPAGGRLARFDQPVEPLLPAIGVTPLPPYIHTTLADPERYQTVYSRVVGSAAAPTAGLHFTPSLIETLAAQDVGFAFVTLHVGLDTFRPVEVEDARRHVMHSEWAELTEATAQAVNATRAAGGRVVAVGTTAVRVLESAALASEGVDPGVAQDFTALSPFPVREGTRGVSLQPYSGWTRLFITPGYSFRAVDGLITNFHLPRSTLLMLVSAFAGREEVLAAYAEAVRQEYRFFSFGDAMLLV